MRVDGIWRRAIEATTDGRAVRVLDQARLPHEVAWLELGDVDAVIAAIRDMQVRGAPLIGAAAGYGVALAAAADPSDAALERACEALRRARPTAVNLAWAVDTVRAAIAGVRTVGRAAAAWAAATAICDDDVERNRALGCHGLALLRTAAAQAGAGTRERPLQVLTHCNAGWLATVDWGTALAPVYQAHEAGLVVHVWVDETRPRNQGMLTAWELAQHGVAHTVIADNAGGHLMQAGRVDLCLVGTDRTTRGGDVANKIGTYLKALAANDCGVPFYVAVPSPSIDWRAATPADIPIEERGGDELRWTAGRDDDGAVARVAVVPDGSAVANPAFDVTPRRLVTGLVTERGVAAASPEGLRALFPEHAGDGPAP
jgi:methylthioribose-1-phosphate isomerase